MHLSRIRPQPDASSHPSFWDRLGDGYTLHQEIWGFFGDRADRERDFQYRIEGHGHGTVLYTLSERPPAVDTRLYAVESKEFDPKFTEGDRLRFLLRANPTVARSEPGRSRGRVHDIVMDAKKRHKEAHPGQPFDYPDTIREAGIEWICAKGDRHGFQVEEETLQVTGYTQHRFRKKNGKQISMSSIDFQGNLEVSDPVALRDALSTGIGRAKGFGFGMMMLRPA